MTSFAGKTVLITGASDGIGAELARLLAAPGVQLALARATWRSSKKRRANARRKAPRRLRCAATSRSRPIAGISSTEPSSASRDRHPGEQRGRVGSRFFRRRAGLLVVREHDARQLFRQLWCTRHALPHLKARRGLLVAVSSLAGKHGIPGRTAYSPSKFAQAAFFEALRVELRGTGVDVTVVFPGVVATDIRIHGYGPDGKAAGVSGLDEKGAMPVEECARLIAEAMLARRRELIMTAKGKLGQWLKLVARLWSIVSHSRR